MSEYESVGADPVSHRKPHNKDSSPSFHSLHILCAAHSMQVDGVGLLCISSG